MSPEKQRIAIAEACGWRVEKCYTIDGLKWSLLRRPCGKAHDTSSGHHNHPWATPDYLTDLNAMHGAEKVLTEKQQAIYVSVLWDIVRGFKPDADLYIPGYWEVPTDSVFAHLHANAAQRAEALLHTLGLWRDEA